MLFPVARDSYGNPHINKVFKLVIAGDLLVRVSLGRQLTATRSGPAISCLEAVFWGTFSYLASYTYYITIY